MTGALFVRQFLAPLVVLAIAASTGLGPAIAIVGAIRLIAAVTAAFVGRLRSDETVAG